LLGFIPHLRLGSQAGLSSIVQKCQSLPSCAGSSAPRALALLPPQQHGQLPRQAGVQQLDSGSAAPPLPPLAAHTRSPRGGGSRCAALGAVRCGQRAAGSFSSGAALPWGVRHGAAEAAGGSMGERRATCAGAGTGLGLGHRAAAAMPSNTPGICAAEPASVMPWRL